MGIIPRILQHLVWARQLKHKVMYPERWRCKRDLLLRCTHIHTNTCNWIVFKVCWKHAGTRMLFLTHHNRSILFDRQTGGVGLSVSHHFGYGITFLFPFCTAKLTTKKHREQDKPSVKTAALSAYLGDSITPCLAQNKQALD